VDECTLLCKIIKLGGITKSGNSAGIVLSLLNLR